MKRARAARTRTVECTDVFGRDVITHIVDSTGKVFVTAPPDETGWFELGELAALNDSSGTARELRNLRVAS